MYIFLPEFFYVKIFDIGKVILKNILSYFADIFIIYVAVGSAIVQLISLSFTQL